jgi:hypothetical protein
MTAGWGAPRRAYLFPAAIAEGDTAAAAAEWKGLGDAERPDVIIALGAQARYAVHLTGQLRGRDARAAAAAAQADEVRRLLGESPARGYVLAALRGVPDGAPEGELWDGALAIASAALRTLAAVGISRLHAALIARRSARLR